MCMSDRSCVTIIIHWFETSRNRILTRNRVLFLLSIILDLQEKHLLFRKDQGNSMKIINSKKSECYYRSSLETKEII